MTRQITFWDAQVSVFRPCPQLGPISAWLVQKGEGAPKPAVPSPQIYPEAAQPLVPRGKDTVLWERVRKGLGSEAAGPPTSSFTSRDLQLAYAAGSVAYLFCQRNERGGNRRSQSSLCFIIYVFTQSLLERSPLQFTVEGS